MCSKLQHSEFKKLRVYTLNPHFKFTDLDISKDKPYAKSQPFWTNNP